MLLLSAAAAQGLPEEVLQTIQQLRFPAAEIHDVLLRPEQAMVPLRPPDRLPIRRSFDVEIRATVQRTLPDDGG